MLENLPNIHNDKYAQRFADSLCALCKKLITSNQCIWEFSTVTVPVSLWDKNHSVEGEELITIMHVTHAILRYFLHGLEVNPEDVKAAVGKGLLDITNLVKESGHSYLEHHALATQNEKLWVSELSRAINSIEAELKKE